MAVGKSMNSRTRYFTIFRSNRTCLRGCVTCVCRVEDFTGDGIAIVFNLTLVNQDGFIISERNGEFSIAGDLVYSKVTSSCARKFKGPQANGTSR